LKFFENFSKFFSEKILKFFENFFEIFRNFLVRISKQWMDNRSVSNCTKCLYRCIATKQGCHWYFYQQYREATEFIFDWT